MAVVSFYPNSENPLCRMRGCVLKQSFQDCTTSTTVLVLRRPTHMVQLSEHTHQSSSASTGWPVGVTKCAPIRKTWRLIVSQTWDTILLEFRVLIFHPLCDIPSGCCFFIGPWTVTRSSLRMLRRVAAFCRPLQPVLLLVSFPRPRSPLVGVPGLCWMWHGVPLARQWRPVVGILRMCWLLPGLWAALLCSAALCAALRRPCTRVLLWCVLHTALRCSSMHLRPLCVTRRCAVVCCSDVCCAALFRCASLSALPPPPPPGTVLGKRYRRVPLSPGCSEGMVLSAHARMLPNSWLQAARWRQVWCAARAARHGEGHRGTEAQQPRDLLTFRSWQSCWMYPASSCGRRPPGLLACLRWSAACAPVSLGRAWQRRPVTWWRAEMMGLCSCLRGNGPPGLSLLDPDRFKDASALASALSRALHMRHGGGRSGEPLGSALGPPEDLAFARSSEETAESEASCCWRYAEICG